MIEFFKENKAFVIIFIVAAITRLIPLNQYQFNYDELCGIRNSVFPSWQQIIDYGVKFDTHPVLVQFIIQIVRNIFGYSEVWIKLPFIIFSMAAIIYAYLFSLKWFGKISALISTAVFSFSYLFLFYAPLARMYASGLFFCTALSYYLFIVLFDEGKRIKHYVLMALFFLLCALNNHLSCFYALTCGVFGLFFLNKKTITPYLITCFIAVLMYLPHLNITFWQLGQGGIGAEQGGWLPIPDSGMFLFVLKTILGTGYVWVVCLLILITSVFINKNFFFNKKSILLLFLFLINYWVIHLYSVYKAPILQQSVMLFSAPCLIWFFSSMLKFPKILGLFIVGILCLVFLWQSVFVKSFFESAVLNQNDYQVKKYIETENRYGKNSVEAVFFDTQHYFVVYYQKKYNKKINYHINLDADLKRFKEIVMTSKADYFLLGNADPVFSRLTQEFYPYLTESKQSLNVNYRLYSKTKNNLTVKNSDTNETLITENDYFNQGKFNFSFDSEKFLPHKPFFKYDVISDNEYPFGVTAYLPEVCNKQGLTFLAKVTLQTDTIIEGVSLNVAIKTDKDSIVYFAGPDASVFYNAKDSSFNVYVQVFVGSEYKKWIKGNYKLVFFIWNRGRKNFSISDFKIQTLDYHNKKWTCWD